MVTWLEGKSSPHQTIFNWFRFNYIMKNAYLFDGLNPWVRVGVVTVHFIHSSFKQPLVPVFITKVDESKGQL